MWFFGIFGFVVVVFVIGIGFSGWEICRGVNGQFEKVHGRYFIQLYIEDDELK